LLAPAVVAVGLLVAAGCGTGADDDGGVEDATPVTVTPGPDDGSIVDDAATTDDDGGDRGDDGATLAVPADGDQTTDGSGETSAGSGDGSAGAGEVSGAPSSDETVPPPAIDEEGELAGDEAPEGRAEVEPPAGALIDLASGSTTELATAIDGLTLVWFWDPTASTSEREAAVAQRFADTFGESIDVVAVGSGGDRTGADAFVAGTGLAVTTLWSADNDAAAYYEVDTVPSSLLVDGAGNIIGRWPGLPEEAFRFAELIG
ncbi:MAG: hypothetical protein AAGA93_06410, partial [Actinomycetota bacterium]